MRILADENIPCVKEAFSTLGEITTMPGRAMSASEVAGADMLLVRSVTRVAEKLLHASNVQFVATATIGTDHLDTEYLDRNGIAWASAPGSNANSVSEYVTAALLVLAGRLGLSLSDMTVGVIGVGNVGSRVASKCRALGMRPMLNDPPLARQTGSPGYLPLEGVLSADVVTLHVPLTKTGPDATHHMVDDGFLARMKDGAILINSSRGAVADTSALLRAADSERLGALVLDVWEGEPDISCDLMSRATIATPHIAGYSYDGKLNGTRMIYEAACRHLNVEPGWQPDRSLPPGQGAIVAGGEGALEKQALRVVSQAYDITQDDGRLRELSSLKPDDRPACFDRLRKTYPVRREFQNYTVQGVGTGTELGLVLKGIGFNLTPRKEADA